MDIKDKNKLLKIAQEIEDLQRKYNYDDFMLAFYMYTRYGKEAIEDTKPEDLEEVNNILNRADSLFDEWLNINTSEYVNEEEW